MQSEEIVTIQCRVQSDHKVQDKCLDYYRVHRWPERMCTSVESTVRHWDWWCVDENYAVQKSVDRYAMMMNYGWILLLQPHCWDDDEPMKYYCFENRRWRKWLIMSQCSTIVMTHRQLEHYYVDVIDCSFVDVDDDRLSQDDALNFHNKKWMQSCRQ